MLLDTWLAKPVTTKKFELFLIDTIFMENDVALFTNYRYLANINLLGTNPTDLTYNSSICIMVTHAGVDERIVAPALLPPRDMTLL